MENDILTTIVQISDDTVLCHVWQVGCHTDNMTVGKAMWACEMPWTCWKCGRCATWCHLVEPIWLPDASRSMNRAMEQIWGLPSAPLWPTCSWKSLRPRPSTLQLTHQDYGEGLFMTPLLSKRQTTGLNFHNTLTPLTLTYSSLLRFITKIDPYPFWIHLLYQDLTTHYLQLCKGNPPTQTSTFIGIATTAFCHVQCV